MPLTQRQYLPRSPKNSPTTNNREELMNSLPQKANQLGVICEISEGGKWTINLRDNWQLVELENRWLLLVRERSQVYLSDAEVLKFLERQSEQKLSLRNKRANSRGL